MRKRYVSEDVLEAPLDPGPISATVDGTRRYAARFDSGLAADFFRALPLRRTASSLGIGTYLGDTTDAEDARYTATVRRAIHSGVNVIDTAINYRCQRSERAIGVALQQVLASGEARRDEILVCTKGGYVPMDGEPPVKRSEYESYLRREFFDAGVMSPDDVVAGGHSLAPSFLRHSIARSRKNLGVHTLDVFYVHNPEQQLGTISHSALMVRLRAAFAALEEAVGRGEIFVYGCATWSALRVAPGIKGRLDLVDLVQLARDVAGEAHHFRVVQLPINLAMPEALRAPTQTSRGGELAPALEVASDLGIAVVASASLMQAQLTRGLPDEVHGMFPAARTDAQCALSFVRALPAVTCALVGMRSIEHLEENLATVKRQ
jgi:aryl-alcohol dehydrogenase-like predicted oxidoreductase